MKFNKLGLLAIALLFSFTLFGCGADELNLNGAQTSTGGGGGSNSTVDTTLKQVAVSAAGASYTDVCAASDGYIYWTNFASDPSGGIYRMAVGDASPTLFYQGNNIFSICYVTDDGNNYIFFSTRVGSNDGIKRVTVPAGTTLPAADSAINVVGGGGTGGFLTNPCYIRKNGDSIFWTEYSNPGYVSRFDLSTSDSRLPLTPAQARLNTPGPAVANPIAYCFNGSTLLFAPCINEKTVFWMDSAASPGTIPNSDLVKDNGTEFTFPVFMFTYLGDVYYSTWANGAYIGMFDTELTNSTVYSKASSPHIFSMVPSQYGLTVVGAYASLSGSFGAGGGGVYLLKGDGSIVDINASNPKGYAQNYPTVILTNPYAKTTDGNLLPAGYEEVVWICSGGEFRTDTGLFDRGVSYVYKRIVKIQ